MSKVKVPKGLEWGFKFVGVDLTTDDHQGGRYRYRLGRWHKASDPTEHSGECPLHPGDGLCVARAFGAASSGGQRLGASAMLLVGFRPGDVLAEQGHKVRVRRLWVAPEIYDPVRLAIGPGANLVGASLYGANLVRANLVGASLYGANLVRANLDGANLDGANLYGANLYGANLYGANLYGANLDGANLDGANLYGANLDGAYGLRVEQLPAGWALDRLGRAVWA